MIKDFICVIVLLFKRGDVILFEYGLYGTGFDQPNKAFSGTLVHAHLMFVHVLPPA